MYMKLGSKRTVWSDSIKNKAREMRLRGLSYGDITSELKIAKSTLHTWLYPIKRPYAEIQFERIQHLNNIRPLAVNKLKLLRENRLKEITNRVQKEIDDFDINNLGMNKAMLAMLYWAEGSKNRGFVDFANTSPELSLLFITLFRKCYLIDEDKFRIRLHLHYYHNITETRNYWSQLLNVPVSKFGKIYIKKRGNSGKRFRKNFYGICFIRYYDEKLRFELIETGRLLAKCYVPIA